jgi:hypothetical protein
MLYPLPPRKMVSKKLRTSWKILTSMQKIMDGIA